MDREAHPNLVLDIDPLDPDHSKPSSVRVHEAKMARDAEQERRRSLASSMAGASAVDAGDDGRRRSSRATRFSSTDGTRGSNSGSIDGKRDSIDPGMASGRRGSV